MTIEEHWKRIAVIGAAGKMGRGISEVLIQSLAIQELENLGAVGTGQYQVYLVDGDREAVYSLRRVLRPRILRFAEKRINDLRKGYEKNPDLVSNEEMIDAFVTGALDNVHLGCNLEDCASAMVVFESIFEDARIKKETYDRLDKITGPHTWYLSNTSSIPIHSMAVGSALAGRIIGFHFYNPPPAQEIVELVIPAGTEQGLREFGRELGSTLKKKIVEAADVAGFIGNGHFIREVAFALREVGSTPSGEQVVFLDSVTRDLLLRPMGIFQLMDFVGISVCLNISRIMGEYGSLSSFHDQLLQIMVDSNMAGGQTVEGTPRDGFFHYEGGKPVSVYDWNKGDYVPIEKGWMVARPEGWRPWKGFPKDEILPYFEALFSGTGKEVELAKKCIRASAEAMDRLVERGVAKSREDVALVLKKGFSHLYSPADLVMEALQ